MNSKIIFWLRKDFTHFGLAHELQNKYEFPLYAIVDGKYELEKFYKEQQIVKFEKIWYYYDYTQKINKNPNLDYLSSFEQKYNVDLLKLISNERIFFKFPEFHKFNKMEILSILEQECRLFEKIIKDVRPDFFIAKLPWFFDYQWEPIHHFQLFYELCLANKIGVLLLNQPNIGNKSIISQEPHKIDFLNFNNTVDKRLKNIDLRNYLKSNDLSKQSKKFVSRYKAQSIKFKLQSLSDSKNSKPYYNYYGRTKINLMFYFFKSYLLKKYRNSFIDNNLENNIDNDEIFVYFPMSVDDEREISFTAPLYTNQIEVIKHIVKSLPVGYKLYVKEHPGQLFHNWRPVSDYKAIMNLPNVRMIHPSVSTESLYENCALTITISGSSGLEAAFYNKPSIILAELGYAVLPSVSVVKTPKEFPSTIRTSLKCNVNVSDLNTYLKLLEKDSFDFDSYNFAVKQFDYFSEDDLKNTDKVVTKIKSFLDDNHLVFEKLALKHFNKIQQHEKFNKNNKSNQFSN